MDVSAQRANSSSLLDIESSKSVLEMWRWQYFPQLWIFLGRFLNLCGFVSSFNFNLPYFLCLFLKRRHFFRTPLFFVTRHMTSAISRNNAMAIDRIITDKTSLSFGSLQCFPSWLLKASAILCPDWSTHQHFFKWTEHWIMWYDPSSLHLGKNSSLSRGSPANNRSLWHWVMFFDLSSLSFILICWNPSLFLALHRYSPKSLSRKGVTRNVLSLGEFSTFCTQKAHLPPSFFFPFVQITLGGGWPS